jgi:hypothetical protein
MRLYIAMYLKTPKLVTRAHLPSCMSFKIHVILETVDVKGAATEGSASDNETPM